MNKINRKPFPVELISQWGILTLSVTNKEGWVLKNWVFRTVVLEKTLESPSDSKEIKPINSKGNQPWIFIGRTDAEAPILWPPDTKSWVIEKDPDAGNDWGQMEKGMTGWNGWMASLTQWTWVWANSERECRTGKPCMLRSMGLQRVRHNLATEQRGYKKKFRGLKW